MKRIGLLFIAVVLLAVMTGCVGEGEETRSVLPTPTPIPPTATPSAIVLPCLVPLGSACLTPHGVGIRVAPNGPAIVPVPQDDTQQ